MNNTIKEINMTNKVKVEVVRETDVQLEYATTGSAGFDISAKEDELILPGMVRKISTGLYMAVPEGYELQIRPRSGLAFKYGITVLNAPGTIDSDYRGEIGVLLINHGTETFKVCAGDRIAQGVLKKVEQAEFVFVDNLSETERGSGGFGHTGV